MPSEMKRGKKGLIICTCVMIVVFLLMMIHTELSYRRLRAEYEALSKANFNLLQEHKTSVKSVAKAETKKMESTTNKIQTTHETTLPPRENKFKDMHKYSVFNPNFRALMEWPPDFILSSHNPILADLWGLKLEPDMPNWEKFTLQISKHYLYEEDSQVVEDMLHDIATQKIIAVETFGAGMQFHLLATFENGGKAIVKFQRFKKGEDVHPNILYFSDFERHNSEIAAYHLDRILGFRRVPPVVGRKVNITKEIYPLADDELLETFYYSPDGNYCFHGKCPLYCDTHHGFCGDPHMIEASFSGWLISEPFFILNHTYIRSPWKRSYRSYMKADWEEDPYFCVNTVRESHPFNTGRRLYDAIDCAIFDFLIGNMDRHHYDEFAIFGNDSTSTIIHMDNGRGFGRPDRDEESILTPLMQCCSVRLSTFNKLYSFHVGPRPLSDLMRESLAKDPLTPVLSEPHLQALDRRVEKALDAIRNCIQVNLAAAVFLDDMT